LPASLDSEDRLELPPPASPTPPFGSRAHFFKEAVLPVDGNRVSAAVVYRAYHAWCRTIGVEAMSRQAFGRESPWSKGKIGGNVYYLGCVMAAGYEVLPTPALRMVNG